MQKYKKPKFTVEDLGYNPFLNSLQIPVRKIIDTKSYKLDEGVLINNQIKLEYTPFTKVFNTSEHRIIVNNLSDKSQRLYLWIIYEIEAGKDYLWVNIDRYMEEQNIKSINTVKNALQELVRYGILNMTVVKNVYWINPDFFFNGNRISKFKQNLVVR